MKELSGRATDLVFNDQEVLTAQKFSEVAQLNDSTVSSYKGSHPKTKDHLPAVEIHDSSKRVSYSQSASDLGAPIERSFDPSSLVPKRIDPRSIVHRIGKGSPQPYYDRYAAGVSVTVSNRSSSAPEQNGGADVSVGVGAEYANPNTRLQIYLQPLGTERRFGIRFSTQF